jgi:hypothetical protein
MELIATKSKANLVFATIPILFFLGCKEGMKTESEDMLGHAKEFLHSKGISTEDKLVFWDEGNKEWLKTLELIEREDVYSKKLDSLADCDFQAIRFSPRDELTLGGVYWVFMDKKSKRVITFLGFK